MDRSEHGAGSAASNPEGRWASLRPPWSALGYPAYRRLFLASLVSNVGGWMEMVAIQWTMAQATLSAEWVASGGAPAPVMMGYLAAAQMVPILVLGMYGGIVADRVDRRRLLATTQALLGVVALALAAASFRGAVTPTLLIALGLVNGVVNAFNMPAWGTVTPRLVPRARLPDAIALNGLQFNLARVVGPAAAGVWLTMGEAGWVFLFNAVSFMGVVAAVMLTPPSPAAADGPSRPWTLLREALGFGFGHRGARAIIGAIFLFSLLATPMLRILPVIVIDVYRGVESDFGLLMAVMGAGAVSAALTIRRVPVWYPRHHLIPVAMTAGGVGALLVAASPGFWWACVPMFISGYCWLMVFNSSFAALQLLVDDRMRGRVMALANVLSFGATPAGALAVGLVAKAWSGREGDGVGSQLGLAILAGVLVLAGVAMLIWRTPEIDGTPRRGSRPRGLGRNLIEGLTAPAHRPRGEHGPSVSAEAREG